MSDKIFRKAKVYVQGPQYKPITEATFQGQGLKYEIVKTLDESDIVVWTGGADIYPGIYGEKALPHTHYSLDRDKADLAAVEKAVAQDKFLIGICRGAQLLNCVPNGGKLWQDVDAHGRIHQAFDCVTGEYVMINSVHHQAMKPTDAAEVLCWAFESNVKMSEGLKWKRGDLKLDEVPEQNRDMEALWYPKTRSFLFQAHPEFGHPPTTKYFFNLLDRVYWGSFNTPEEVAA